MRHIRSRLIALQSTLHPILTRLRPPDLPLPPHRPNLPHLLTLLTLLLTLSTHSLPSSAQLPPLPDLMGDGTAAYAAGRLQDARSLFQQAEETARTQHLRLNQALALSYLALTQHHLGERAPAQTAIEESLRLLTNASDDAAGMAVRSRVFNTYGQLLLAWGQPEAALEQWDRAIAAYRASGDEMGVIGTQINQAQVLRSLGFLRRAQNQIETIERQLRSQPVSSLTVAALRSLGTTLRAVGQLDASQTVLTTSVTQARELQEPGAIAAALLSLGNTEQRLGDRQVSQRGLARWILLTQQPVCPTSVAPDAIPEGYQQAIAAYQQAATLAPTDLLRIQAQLNHLDVRLKTQDWPDPNELQALGERVSHLTVSRPAIASQVHLAERLLCLGSVPTALDALNSNASAEEGDRPVIASAWSQAEMLLRQAMTHADQLGDRRALAEATGTLGWLQEIRGDRPSALPTTEAALQWAKQSRASDLAYRWQWQLARLKEHQGDRPAALAHYQAAVTTLNDLRADLVALDTTIQFSFRERIEPLYRQYVRLLLHDPQPDDLLRARDTIEALQLAELDNFFQDACSETRPEAVDQVANQSNAVVFYSIFLDDRLEMLVKIPGQPDLFRYSVAQSPATLSTTLLEFRRAALVPFGLESLQQKGQELYRLLIEPAIAQIHDPTVDTLVFVLDGPLRNISLTALHDGRHYLAETYAIALAPGLQLIDPQPLEQGSVEALIAGITEARLDFEALPNVAAELEAIRALVPTPVQLVNEEFVEARLEQAIQHEPISIVHLATHGQFSSKSENTFILAYDRKLKVEDLATLLRDRPTRQPSIELLVLSACETATGDARAALGLAGIAVRAGARSTLATLWKADDAATALLIQEFYRQMADHNWQISKAIALQKAQSYLIQHTEFNHPVYWAPFVLLGNWL